MECLDYSKVYMMTAYVIHAKKNLLTSAATKGGSWYIREFMRTHTNGVNDYVYHTRANCNFKAIKTDVKRDYYTEDDVVDTEDNIIAMRALNRAVLITCTAKDPNTKSPFRLVLSGNTALKQFLEDIVAERIKPTLKSYMETVNKLTNGLIQICVRIENITTYMRNMFVEGRCRHIELPNVQGRRFTLEEAVTMALTRKPDALPPEYKPYIDKYKEIGFVEYNEILEGIFCQQLSKLLPDDCLPNFMLTLDEMRFCKKLYVEDIVKALSYCRDNYNILRELEDFEFIPLAEYWIDVVNTEPDSVK